MAPKQYIEKMCANFECLFGHLPKQSVTSPIEKNSHPELDTSDLQNEDDIVKYQSLIGALQWVVSIRRFDVMAAVMTLSSFRAAPQHGHMEQVKHVCGYLAKMMHGMIHICIAEPDYSDLSEQDFDLKTHCLWRAD